VVQGLHPEENAAVAVEYMQVSAEERQESAKQQEQAEQQDFRLFLVRVDARAQQLWVWLLDRGSLR